MPLIHEPDVSLVLRGVCKTYHAGLGRCSATVRALDGVDLDVRAGEILAILGGAGAGKTSLLRCAAGMTRADAGVVRWRGAVAPAYVQARVERPHAPVPWSRRPDVWLIDDYPAPSPGSAVEALLSAWITRLADGGAAVVVAARRPEAVVAIARAVPTLRLHAGRLVAARAGSRHVAERHAGGDAPARALDGVD